MIELEKEESAEVIIESKSIIIDVEKEMILIPYPTKIKKIQLLLEQFEKGFREKEKK